MLVSEEDRTATIPPASETSLITVCPLVPARIAGAAQRQIGAAGGLNGERGATRSRPCTGAAIVEGQPFSPFCDAPDRRNYDLTRPPPLETVTKDCLRG